MSKVKKLFTVLGTVLLVVLLAVVIVMFNARISGEAPNVFGYQIFRVSSGSMEPELMIGDVILVKDVEPEDVKAGDIVTYKGEEGDLDNKFITHKMLETPTYTDGHYVFKSQGIAQGTIADPDWYEDQLIGVYVCTIPFIDSIYNFFVTPYGLIAFILVIVVLFGYEMISLIISYKTMDELDYDDEDDHNDVVSSSEDTEQSDSNDKII